MLTSRITKTIEHPDEPGVSFTLRKLSYAHIEEAEDVKREKALSVMKSLDGISLPESTAEQKAEQARLANEPDQKYDRTTVLRRGITAWTYDAELSEQNIADLDESTAAWLFATIITHSLRSVDEGEASGSDSAPITA